MKPGIYGAIAAISALVAAACAWAHLWWGAATWSGGALVWAFATWLEHKRRRAAQPAAPSSPLPAVPPLPRVEYFVPHFCDHVRTMPTGTTAGLRLTISPSSYAVACTRCGARVEFPADAAHVYVVAVASEARHA